MRMKGGGGVPAIIGEYIGRACARRNTARVRVCRENRNEEDRDGVMACDRGGYSMGWKFASILVRDGSGQ